MSGDTIGREEVAGRNGKSALFLEPLNLMGQLNSFFEKPSDVGRSVGVEIGGEAEEARSHGLGVCCAWSVTDIRELVDGEETFQTESRLMGT